MKTAILISIILLLAMILVLLSGKIRSNQEIKQIYQQLYSANTTQQTFTEDMIAGLPAPVQRYFLHAIALGTLLSNTAKLDMQGQFRLGRDQSWLPMNGQEIITPQGFVWQAKIGRGLFQFRGADYYINGLGGVRFSLWGLLPVANQHDENTTRASIGRLIPELIWLPSALLPQQGVEWTAITDHQIQANLKLDREPVSLILQIDANGRVLQLSSLRWGNHTEDGHWAYIPFGGECQAEKTFDGLTIPSQLQVGWWFGTEHYFNFFQSTIENAQFQPNNQ